MGSRPCCCIPNRGATIVLSLFAIIVASLFLAGTFVIISTNALNTPMVIPAVIFGFSNLLLFISSWVGFFGAILRKRRAVAFYAVILTILWVTTLIVGLWNIIVIFKNRNSVIDSCVAKSYAAAQGGPFDSNTARGDCGHAHSVLSAVVVVVWVLYQLIDLWFIAVVYALRRELLDKSMADKRFVEQQYVVNTTSGTHPSRTSEESKMSSRSGGAVSVPYRPTGGRAPMGPYVSSGASVGSCDDKVGTQSDNSGTVNSGPNSSSPPTTKQAKRMSMGKTMTVSIDHDRDWHHEITPVSAFHDTASSHQSTSLFASRYDERYGS